jgi:nitrate reductase gamma subunit
MFDTVLFAAFPYVAVALAVVGGIVRYFGDRFSFSSQSSQFLENRVLFWGSVSWHYGIIVVLLAHIAALAVSGTWGDLVANPARLYTLEVIGIAFGLAALIGLTALSLRRVLNARVTVVTAKSDWALLAVLLAQVVLGMWVALGYRWGSDWYVHTAAPWVHSLFRLQPDVATVTVLPWVVKAHMLGGFVLLAMFPFTRLVHIVTYPITYLWRPYQVVIWNRRATR